MADFKEQHGTAPVGDTLKDLRSDMVSGFAFKIFQLLYPLPHPHEKKMKQLEECPPFLTL